MTDKITIERETLLPCPFCGGEAEILTIPEDHPDAGAMFVQCWDSRCMTSSALLYPLMDDVRALLVERWNRRAALAQKAEPPSMPQGKSLALLDLDSVEHMQGGANGPTIRLRGFINAQTGPTAPQPPIDNAFVADGCEQFSPPAEPAPVPCCGKCETCSHACTPRGKWLGRREAERAALAAQPAPAAVPPGYVLVPIEPTPEMVAAYLSANTEYWRLVDGFPPKIGVWRNGTPSQATAESYRAMIAAAKRVAP